jgi:hypothetical protein
MTDVMPEQLVDLDELTGGETTPANTTGLDAVDEQLIAQLAGRARAGGLQLAGEGGLLAQLTKRLVESALEGELTDHLGYGRHDASGRDGRELPQRAPSQDGVDRGRAGRDRRPPRPGRHLRAEDRRQAAAAAVRGRRAGDLAVREGSHHRGGAGAPGRGLRRAGVPPDDLHDHRQGRRGHGRVGRTGPSTRSTR